MPQLKYYPLSVKGENKVVQAYSLGHLEQLGYKVSEVITFPSGGFDTEEKAWIFFRGYEQGRSVAYTAIIEQIKELKDKL